MPTTATFELERQWLTPGKVERLQLLSAGTALRVEQVLAGWADDGAFVLGFAQALASSPLPAFFWEMPALTVEGLTRPFECVLVDAPALAATTSDPTPFAEIWATSSGATAAFANLGGDAWLIAPRPRPDVRAEACADIARFCRLAGAALQQSLWRRLAEELRPRIGAQPLWLSTSGLGVSWLHLRLDQRPKYYSYAPYRRAP